MLGMEQLTGAPAPGVFANLIKEELQLSEILINSCSHVFKILTWSLKTSNPILSVVFRESTNWEAFMIHSMLPLYVPFMPFDNNPTQESKSQ